VITFKNRGGRLQANALKAALLLLLVSCAAVLSACQGGGDEEQTSVASCDSISDIQSYRYTINLKLRSPAFSTVGPTTTPAPLTAFADALQALFSDLKLDGAFKAPDRTQVLLKFQGGDLELREIGDDSWIRVGSTWRVQDPAEGATTLTPDVLCRDIVDEIVPSLSEIESSRETVNGLDTDRYKLDEANLKQLPALLGTGSDVNLPNNYSVDVWLARKGRFPVRLNVAAEDVDDLGRPIGLTLFMEFRDINDSGITVEPPTLSQTSR
jgi:hypothetical protein